MEHKITLGSSTPDGDSDYVIWRNGSGGTVEILDIAVQSKRGIGRGKLLIETLFAEINRIHEDNPLVFAITRSSYPIAQQFYEHLGFRVVGVLRDFYTVSEGGGVVGVDAIMYGRSARGPV